MRTARTNAQNQAAYRSRQTSLRKNFEGTLLKLRMDLESLRKDLRNLSRAVANLYNSSSLPTLDSESLTKNHMRIYDPRFVRWFSEYPEKVGKGAAEASFLKALKFGATEEVLAEGLRRYVAYKPADRPWCNPATWLNQERWNDEYPAAKPNGHMPTYGRIRDPTEIMAEIEARDRAKETRR